MSDTTTNHSTDRSAEEPQTAIRAGFQVSHAAPVALGEAWGEGWRCDQAVLIPSDDRARATWTAQVMDQVRPSGVSVARPLRSTDGRYTLGGWTARGFLRAPCPRFDETAASALRFNEALAKVDGASAPGVFDVRGCRRRGQRVAGGGVGNSARPPCSPSRRGLGRCPTELLAPVMDLPGAATMSLRRWKATGLMLLRTGSLQPTSWCTVTCWGAPSTTATPTRRRGPGAGLATGRLVGAAGGGRDRLGDAEEG